MNDRKRPTMTRENPRSEGRKPPKRLDTRGASIIEYLLIAGLVALAAIQGFKQARFRENRVIARQAKIVLTLDEATPDPSFDDPMFGDDITAPFCTIGGACTRPGQCFSKGTLVAAETGLVPIETIQKGDLIWSRDETSGDLALRPVLRRYVTNGQAVMSLHVSTPDGDETIRATTGHPFWVPGRGWVSAGELAANQKLWSPLGEPLYVTTPSSAAEASPRSGVEYETVYNLEIAEFHTYFVGRHELWVHNATAPPGPGPEIPPCQRPGYTPPVPASELPPPGTCTQEQYNGLRAQVVATKDAVGRLGKCTAADAAVPGLLQKKADAWKAQAIARNTLDGKCFGGGNAGHQQASAAAWQNWGNCKILGAN